MHISNAQFCLLFSLNSHLNGKPYSEIYRAIPNNRGRFTSRLPISMGMLYKRVFEMKKEKLIETISQNVFPSFAIVKITNKAAELLKSSSFLMNFISIFQNKKEIQIIPDENQIKTSHKKKIQKSLISFVDIT